MLGLEHQLARTESSSGDCCNPFTVSWEGLFVVITLPQSPESWSDWYENLYFSQLLNKRYPRRSCL